MFEKLRHRLGKWLLSEKRDNRRITVPRLRSYAAAVSDRLSADWPTGLTSTDQELQRALRALRARSRDLARNDPYVRKFLSMVEINVIGPNGIRLQSIATRNGALLTDLNNFVEKHWQRWGGEFASASGKFSWCDLERLAIRQTARDGEVLLRFVRSENPYGLTLHAYSADWLDEQHCTKLPNGNRILMGIEVDPYDCPVAYHLKPPTHETWYRQLPSMQTEVVPASDIIHLFLPEANDQTRGVPWTAAVLGTIKGLNAYTESEIVAARIASCKMGFYKREVDDETPVAYDENGNPVQAAADLIDQVEPGVLTELPPGVSLEMFDPKHPTDKFADFFKANLRAVASGLGIPYNELANDLEGVNYSSIRAGIIESRLGYRVKQDWIAKQLHTRVYRRWLRESQLTGILPMQTGETQETLYNPRWQPQGFAWVDPKNDLEAQKIGLEMGLTSYSDVMAMAGDTPEDVWKRRESERKLAEQYGETLPPFNPEMKKTVA